MSELCLNTCTIARFITIATADITTAGSSLRDPAEDRRDPHEELFNKKY